MEDQEKNRAICLLGMHRSGTSAVTRAVNLLGVFMGSTESMLPPAENNNPKGFWEHTDIVNLHEDILRNLDRTWHDISPMDDNWADSPKLATSKNQLIDLVNKDFADRTLWGWKDPRTCLLIPYWKDVAKELNFDISFLIIVRNPLDVANSLMKRDNLSLSHSLLLWQTHMTSALINSTNYNRAVIHYDHFLTDWKSSLQSAAKVLDIPWPEDDTAVESALGDFIDRDLRHSQSDMNQLISEVTFANLPNSIVTTYKMLLEAEANPALLNTEEFTRQIESITSENSDYIHKISNPKTLRDHNVKNQMISVIMPSYQHEEYIGETIDSVLNQSYENFELIIVDDGSTDGTKEVIKQYNDQRIRFYEQDNQGAPETINRGISLAKGEYISIINSDDTYHPERLSSLMETAINEDAAFIFTNLSFINEKGKQLETHSEWYENLISIYNNRKSLEETFFAGNIAITSSNFFFKSEILDEIGLFNSYRYVHDYDFILRVLHRYPDKFVYLSDKKLLSYRLHETNTISDSSTMPRIETLKLLFEQSPEFMNNNEDKILLKTVLTNMRALNNYLVWEANNHATRTKEHNELLTQQLKQQEQLIHDQTNTINDITNSWSWEITRPLRWVYGKLNTKK